MENLRRDLTPSSSWPGPEDLRPSNMVVLPGEPEWSSPPVPPARSTSSSSRRERPGGGEDVGGGAAAARSMTIRQLMMKQSLLLHWLHEEDKSGAI